MMPNKNPLVSVLTPVYNAEKYLEVCIKSILAQTYENWEYVIVNNCSTDGSLKIATKYALKDNRIRIYNNQIFMGRIQNLNYTMQQISHESKYCKVVHADDWIFPDCLRRMVEIAESYPSIGIVSAYRLNEKNVDLDGLPYPSNFVPGKEICREKLIGGLHLFGSPTSLLIRSDIIRKKKNFYNESNIHSDTEVCFDILQNYDFGFVHQVLTFTRRHNESATYENKNFCTQNIGKLKILKKYGFKYLSESEYKEKLKMKKSFLYVFLAKSVLESKNKELYHYYKSELKKIGCSINYAKLIKAIVFEILNFKDRIKHIKNGFSK